ncbi:MAG: hypothetical protein JST68_20645 [Bacteroidetes bacterium]|nr:hypothetical protein [Bacteroidota bacterium]
MKLSKTLLSAIVLGMTVQAVSSCHKEHLTAEQKKAEAEKKKTEQTTPQTTYPDSCPACGMG